MTEDESASPPDDTFAIIGAGRLGTSLGVLLQHAGRKIVAVAARSGESRRRAAEWLDAPVMDDPAEASAGAGSVLLTTSDDAVAEVCRRIAGALDRGAFVIHTSGALGLEPLAPAAEAGARTLAIHVLQSVPDVRRGVTRIPGSWFGVTCDPDLRTWAEKLVTDLGGSTLFVPEDRRASYHAAAVLASNYLITLGGLAAEAFGEFEPYLPLMRGTLENLADLGPAKALTGPVVRADTGTVARHLRALPPHTAEGYRAMAAQTLRLAAEAGRIDEKDAERLRRVIGESQ
ncbi:MAG: Rossmann-like and DUF2520 domain-containing protein [Actinomycetota bacterium]